MLYIENIPICHSRHPFLGAKAFQGHSSLKHRSPLNVESRLRAPLADPDQQDVDQHPDAQATKAEELAEAFSPLSQVEPVRAEATKGDAQSQGHGPLIAAGPVAIEHHGKRRLPRQRTRPRTRQLAGRVALPGTDWPPSRSWWSWSTAVSLQKLPAKSASHVDDEVLLGSKS